MSPQKESSPLLQDFDKTVETPDTKAEDDIRKEYSIDPKYTEIILQPFEYYQKLPSKNIRRKIADIFNYWYRCSKEDIDRASTAMHGLHNASLIIDDIEDGSDMRRGQPAAHIQFGVPLALNAANYVYFDSVKRIIEEKNDEATPEDRLKATLEFVNAMMVMHVAQGMEIFWRDENLKGTNSKDSKTFQHIPTEQEYFDIIVKKTAGQFVMLSESLKERSKTLYKDQPALSAHVLASSMGYHFQIRDDLLNLISNTYEAGKGFCEDITEGKYSFPIIYTLNRYHEKDGIGIDKAARLLEILRMRTTDRALKKEAYDIIEESGAFEYTKNVLREYHGKIGREVLRLGGNPVFVEHMDIFAEVF